MKIKKMFQGEIPENKIMSGYSDSQTDTYSCDYVNRIIETGSNANGEWIKYANGIMEVTQKYTIDSKKVYVAMGTLKRVGLNVPPDFPQSFIEPPIVHITLHNCWLAWLMGAELKPTTTNATGGILIPIASATEVTLEGVEVHITAKGRWK